MIQYITQHQLPIPNHQQFNHQPSFYQNHHDDTNLLDNTLSNQINPTLNQITQLKSTIKQLRQSNGLMLADIYYLRQQIEYYRCESEKYRNQVEDLMKQKNKWIKKSINQFEKAGRSVSGLEIIKQQIDENQELNKVLQSLREKDERIIFLNKQLEKISKQKNKISKKYRQMAEQNKYLKKANEIANKNLGLSHEMDSYNEEERNVIRQHNDLLVQENKKLNVMWKKYYNDSKQLQKIKLQMTRIYNSLKQRGIQLWT